MKVDKFKQDIDDMKLPELQEKLDSLQRGLFSLKLNASTAHIKDYSLYKKFRKDIARVSFFRTGVARSAPPQETLRRLS